MSRYTLHAPAEISSRLMPAVRIGGATLSIDYGRITSDGRMAYDIWIDLPDGSEYDVTDLRSGVGGGNLQSGLGSLLSFLSACGESIAYGRRAGKPGENADLFPAAVGEWADMNSDELSCLACDLEEGDPIIIEE